MSDFKWTQAKEIKRGDVVRLNGIGDIEVEHVVIKNEVIITAKSDWKPRMGAYKPSTRYSFETWQEVEVKQ